MRKLWASLSNVVGSSRSPEPLQSPTSQNGVVSEQELWRGTSPSSFSKTKWNPEFASDPAVWESQFLVHWEKLRKLISYPSNNVTKTFNDVRDLLGQLCNLLIMEINSQPEATIGQLLEHCFNQEIFLRIHDWAVQLPLYLVPMCQVLLLQTYEDVVNRSQSPNHCLLVHKPILVPLLKLLQWCRKSAEERRFQLSNVDKYFVQLLNQICTRISDDLTLLEFFFNSHFSSKLEYHKPINGGFALSNRNNYKEEEDQPFLVFSLLIPYMYSAEDIGQLARDALLLLMAVSHDLDFLAKHVSEISNFCPVLAGGLSGCFSQLPRCIFTALQISEHEEFHKLNTITDIDQIIELSQFHRALLFCNAVIQVAHQDIIREIVHFFYDGFLLEVFKPAVLQSDVEDLVSKVVYFHLCMETVTEPALIQALLKVLIVAETNVCDMNLLEIILSKMNTTEKLCRVVLSLLKTLMELRSEDLMWNCLIRFILPFIPLKPTSRRFDVNVSLDAANFFLSCIPACTLNFKELNSEELFNSYLREAALAIEETSCYCKCWAFKYDGAKPNALLNMNGTEELLSTRQPFIRLSSARSSFASTGWNRYFQNRSAHGTHESTMLGSDATTPADGIAPLNILGEEESTAAVGCSHEKYDSLLNSAPEEISDFNSQYDILSNPHLDYFQFAYEGISESDEKSDESTSRRNSNSYKEEAEENCKDNPALPNEATEVVKQVPLYAAAINSTSWLAAKKISEFLALLERLPAPDKISKSTTEENIALIESRLQYFKELTAEQSDGDAPSLFKLNLNPKCENAQNQNGASRSRNGLLITCTDEKGPGILLECLLSALDKLVERSFQTNLQLVAVLEMLLSYPQPVITSYLIYVDAIKSNAIYRITNVLKNLKSRIDAYASSTEGFEEMLSRGIRHKISRAERLEKSNRQGDSSGRRTDRNMLAGAVAATSTTIPNSARAAFHFTHKTMESVDKLLDSSRNKNYAYAAIILSQLCQIFAAHALQQSAALEYPKSTK